MISVFDLAKIFYNTDPDISHARLNILCYLCQAHNLADTGNALFYEKTVKGDLYPEYTFLTLETIKNYVSNHIIGDFSSVTNVYNYYEQFTDSQLIKLVGIDLCFLKCNTVYIKNDSIKDNYIKLNNMEKE